MIEERCQERQASTGALCGLAVHGDDVEHEWEGEGEGDQHPAPVVDPRQMGLFGGGGAE